MAPDGSAWSLDKMTFMGALGPSNVCQQGPGRVWELPTLVSGKNLRELPAPMC
jgi:hypothetical protein